MLSVWDSARQTSLLTDASELAVSAILVQPDDARGFLTVAFESCKLTQPKCQYPPHLFKLLAVEHELKTIHPYLLDKLNLLAKHKYTVVHILAELTPQTSLTATWATRASWTPPDQQYPRGLKSLIWRSSLFQPQPQRQQQPFSIPDWTPVPR